MEEILPQKVCCFICFLPKLKHETHTQFQINSDTGTNMKMKHEIKIKKKELNMDLKGPDVRVIDGGEDVFDLRETALVIGEIEEIAALEIDLDEDQTLVVFALNRLEEAPAT